MKEIVPNSSGGSGNTSTEPLLAKKQISPSKRWCFTFNNYTQKDIDLIVPILDSECKMGLFGKEVGKACGTPHLQGYCEFIQKVRPKNMFSTKIHWKKCRGTRADNVIYCSKDGELVWSKGLPLPVQVISPDFEWEQEILSIIKTKPDDRTIHWFYGEGNIGKTSFCKYLVVKCGAIVLSGKGNDIRNGIIQYKDSNGDTPNLIVLNIPRSVNTEYVSYEGIENIKDMLFYSGKYEGGMICGNNPHLFCFANTRPEEHKLSLDRWDIREIGTEGKFLL